MHLLQPALPSFYLTGGDASATSQETYVLRNPKDVSIEADKGLIAGREDVDAAVKYAEEAFNGPWSKFSAMQRTTCFYQLVELLENRLVEIPTLDSLTTGIPVSLIPTREKNDIKTCLVYYYGILKNSATKSWSLLFTEGSAGWTDKRRGDSFAADDGFVKLVPHEPLGVCAAINPFDAPVAPLIHKAAPCLATGNVLIIKPSEKSPWDP